MTSCWAANPKERPPISSIRELLETYLAEVESGKVENASRYELRENIDEIMDDIGGEKCWGV